MPPAIAITIGTFDSVHVGHAALIDAAREHIGADGTVLAASFDPHPKSILMPRNVPPRLTTFAHRQHLLLDKGVDEVIRLEPTPELLARTPRQFVEQILQTHNPSFFIEGNDFKFGARRKGSIQTLIELGNEFGFTTVSLPPVCVATAEQISIKASSTAVRWLLSQGRVRDAATMLDRPYAITGIVTQGRQMGRCIGYPTANLSNIETMLPADGVYAGWAILPDGSRLPAALSLGTNPTFPNAGRSAEAHIIDWPGPDAGQPEYNWLITLEFTAWIREQISYPGVRSLVNQIERDVHQANTILIKQPFSWSNTLQEASP
jgi:riboflavin kinase / FMN adenylyltransferase